MQGSFGGDECEHTAAAAAFAERFAPQMDEDTIGELAAWFRDRWGAGFSYGWDTAGRGGAMSDERAVDLATDCGVPVEWVERVAMDRLLMLDEHDLVIAIEAAGSGREWIETAALRIDGEVWTLPRPTRHHTLARAWSLANYKDGKSGFLGEHESGFVTSRGRYVDRIEAGRIAVAAGQIPELRWPPRLYSEDLW